MASVCVDTTVMIGGATTGAPWAGIFAIICITAWRACNCCCRAFDYWENKAAISGARAEAAPRSAADVRLPLHVVRARRFSVDNRAFSAFAASNSSCKAAMRRVASSSSAACRLDCALLWSDSCLQFSAKAASNSSMRVCFSASSVNDLSVSAEVC